MSDEIVRQTISVLCADIRSFTTFLEPDPEKILEMINAFWTIASDAIRVRNGVIDKFLGDIDTIVALYNTPLRPENDHGLCALRSADTMVSECRAYNSAFSARERFSCGVGVHTGEAIFGNVGSPDDLVYTALGDSVNFAKRLNELSSPMQIVLSDGTYKQVKDRVEVEQLEPMRIKGLAQPLGLYELVQVR